jgi:hypothetical protein
VAGVAVVCLIGVVVARLTANEDKPLPAAATGAVPGQVTGFRRLTIPALGYAVEVPAGWVPAADNSPTTISYNAAFRPSAGALRVTVGQDDADLADHVNRLIVALGQQGGVDFRQAPTQIDGLAAVKLDYRFPLGPNPGPAISSHTSYLVKRDATVFSFQLASTSPTAEKPLFDHIVSSIRLL